MMDLATIQELNREAGEEARDAGREPYTFSEFDVKNLHNGDLYPIRKIPRLGDYTPKGWKKIDSLFVDSSGFGREDEPALTAQQFAKKIERGLGYGIGSVGQFQLYIDVFVKADRQ